MDNNIVRSIIFLVAGLIVLLLPQQVNKFQISVLKKLHVKFNEEINRKYNLRLGIVFIVISVILFVVSIIY